MTVTKGGYKFTKMPIDRLIDPKQAGYFYHMTDRYWPVTEDDCVIFYGNARSPYSSPQCNSNRAIASRFRNHLPKDYHIKDVILIPIAFTPINLADYQE
jgi:hypothetical protein